MAQTLVLRPLAESLANQTLNEEVDITLAVAKRRTNSPVDVPWALLWPVSSCKQGLLVLDLEYTKDGGAKCRTTLAADAGDLRDMERIQIGRLDYKQRSQLQSLTKIISPFVRDKSPSSTRAWISQLLRLAATEELFDHDRVEDAICVGLGVNWKQ